MCANNHLPPDFESIFSEVNSIEEQAPGVYYIIAWKNARNTFRNTILLQITHHFSKKSLNMGKNCEI